MVRQNRYKRLAVLNVIGFLGTILVNFLANAVPLNGKTTGEISNQYPNLFVPAPITFAIWGLIYLLLAIFCVYQLTLAFSKRKGTRLLDQIGYAFVIASIANMSWIFAWHYDFLGLSVIFMVVLLASLIQIYLSLKINYKDRVDSEERYFVHLPFSVYLGWISIATMANVTVYLVSIGWNGFGLSEAFWATMLISVGILLALLFLFKNEDIYYALVIDWALLGIVLERITADIKVVAVIWSAIIGILVLTANILLIISKKINWPLKLHKR